MSSDLLCQTSTMTNLDVSKLSLKGVEQLTAQCEYLIYSHKAVLEDYELYIECQTELAKRGADTQAPFAGATGTQFLSS